ncbi:MAG: hypothetical protein OEV92_00120 [Nitrospinota bacterium]|nr:hypothetical protein [Nitrospinota bacterium]
MKRAFLMRIMLAVVLSLCFAPWAPGGYAAQAKSSASLKLGAQDRVSGKLGDSGSMRKKVTSGRVTSGVDMEDRIKSKLEEGVVAVGEGVADIESADLLKAQALIEAAMFEREKKKSTLIIVK